MTAATVAVAPSVKEPTHPAPVASVVHVVAPDVALTAAVRPGPNPNGLRPAAESLVAPASLPNLLVEWLQRIVVPPSASAPLPTPQFPPVVAPTSIGSSIKAVYNAVEPWVEWGFDLAAYAAGWVPYVGWLAPQISIFYDFGELIVRSITFNTADWLDNRISFGQGLVNVGVDTVNAFIFLANAQLAFWLPPLPPIPPLPPVFLPFAEVDTTPEAETTADLVMAASAEEATEAQPAGEVDETLDAVDSETMSEEDSATETVEPVTETEIEESETLAKQTEDTKDVQTNGAELTMTSAGTVRAQGEVRDTGIDASPDDRTAKPESPSADGETADETADESDETEASTTAQPDGARKEPSRDKEDSEAA